VSLTVSTSLILHSSNKPYRCEKLRQAFADAKAATKNQLILAEHLYRDIVCERDDDELVNQFNPDQCQLDSLRDNANRFFSAMRNKAIYFVGDSVCLCVCHKTKTCQVA
jgi:hypothetical protein